MTMPYPYQYRQIDFLFDALELRAPSMAREFRQSFSNPHVCHATDAIASLFALQNREIHKEAMVTNPMFTLAEREQHWIDIGGPQRFFSGIHALHSELFAGSLYAGFNAFQFLLFGLHAEHVAWNLGRNPNPEELINEEWFGRCGRLRERFAPILQEEDYATKH